MKPFFSPAGCSHFNHLEFPVLILSSCHNTPEWFNKVPMNAIYHIFLHLDNKFFLSNKDKNLV